MNPDYQKICLQLQLQRNSFADAHATAAARGDQLAEEVERLKAALDTNSETIIRLREELKNTKPDPNNRIANYAPFSDDVIDREVDEALAYPDAVNNF